jgi:hypothetical protein
MEIDTGKKLVQFILDNFIILQNESDNEIDEKQEYVDLDIPKIVEGHIPILFEPCCDYKWYGNKYYEESLEIFKYHYTKCQNCFKTNNNSEELYPYINNSEIWFSNTNIKDTNKYLELYHNLKNYTFTLMCDDKKYNHIYVLKINKLENTYKNCLIIVW